MKEYILDNGAKLIYKKGVSSLTSISISVDAGAATEEDLFGVAHATEHMVYKGTFKRSESDINKELSEIFGFQNAMTNYPYVIYYGTLLSEDLKRGLELFSDIILNPSFKEEGFKEELSVIKEELKEWDDDLEQYSEDKLFFNTFNNRRIKYPIIGRIEDLDRLTLEDIKRFYKNRYTLDNISIAVVTDLEFNEVLDAVHKYFNKQTKNESFIKEASYDIEFNEYKNTRESSNTSRILRVYPIDNLNLKELSALRIINELYAEGVDSILYTKLRTERGLVYDVLPKIAFEKYIKLYKIGLNISKENIDEALYVLDLSKEELHSKLENITKEKINSLIKSIKLKRLFKEEQSIVLAKELSTYNTMFNDCTLYEREIDILKCIDLEDLLSAYKKVFKNCSTEIVINK
ncbi:MAG: M16 family metallopeptidase [Clostridium sp.]|uniref:M16 family metallopeptidase n=1 Tax=Clostridium chrysemydis TaxID=2665504 RepID=UPI003EE6E51C